MDRGRVRGLDGIRALAALMVFAEHQFWPAHWMMTGRLGVEIFFVLSGYLIVGILAGRAELVEAGTSTRQSEIVRFFLHRSFRIFPAYYGLIAVFSILAVLGLFQVNWNLYPFYLTYSTNWYFAHILHDWPKGQNFGHFWTLAIEEQFYLFLAPVFLCLAPRLHRAACLALVGLAAVSATYMIATHTPWFSVGMDSLVNFGYLALGGLISQSTRPLQGTSNRPLQWCVAGVVAIFGACAMIRPQGAAEFAVSEAMGLVSALTIWNIVRHQQSGIVGALDVAPLRWLGRISYGFYLYHVFVKFPPTGIAFKGVDLIIVANLAVTIVLAQASWMLIESPSLRLRDKLIAPGGAKRAAVVAA